MRELVVGAVASPVREVCGFITHDWEVIPVCNVSEDNKAFIMDEAELLDLMVKYSGQFLGVYHSHPSGDPRPSATDETFSYNAYYRYFIVTAVAVYEWRFTDDGPKSITPHGVALSRDMAYPLSPVTEEV